MNLPKLVSLTFFIVMVSLSEVFSQDIVAGYVITIHNDTIKCDFKYPISKLKYKPVNSTKYIKLTVDEIKEFHIIKDSAVYEAIQAGRGLAYPEFLKRMEEGEINLYEQDNSWTLNQNSIIPGTTFVWYVNKKNKPLTELKSENVLYDSSRKSRKESFIQMISDDPELAEKLKNEKKFDLKTLRYYIKDYNTYKNSHPTH